MSIETKVAQKDKLYTLLSIKKEYEDSGLEIKSKLEYAISFSKAVMNPEDVAYVEKQVYPTE